MTLSTTSNTSVTQGNGLTNTFSFNFIIPLAAELFVTYVDNNGISHPLLPSQYGVAGLNIGSGGSVTYPLSGSPIALGSYLIIQRIVPYQQLTSLVNQSGYYPNVVEGALDNLTMQTQQLSVGLANSLQVGVSNNVPNLVITESATARENQLVGFDDNGNVALYNISASVGAGNMTSEGPFVAGVGFTPGVTTQLVLSNYYASPANISVHYDGVFQGPDQYSLAGDVITFTAPIPVGVSKVYIIGGTTLSVGVPNVLSLPTGSSLMGYNQGSAGAATITQQVKNQQVVSVSEFYANGISGATVDLMGLIDSTAGIQAALNSGANAVFVPAGTIKFSSLTMPTSKQGFNLYGCGTASVLVQTGAGISYPIISSAACFDSHATIKDLAFNGTLGTGNTLDTSYCQTLDLINLYFTNVPVGHASLKLDGNSTNPTYMHDVRVRGLRIYHTSGNGNAGLELGSYASDSLITDFVMQGDFLVNYCILADSNAQTISFANCHPYNAKINVLSMTSNANFSFTNCIFDNSLAPNISLTSCTNNRFVNCWVEGINASQIGISLINSYNNNFVSTAFATTGGVAASCVTESSGSSGNKFSLGQIDSLSNYVTPFTLTGYGSFQTGFQGLSSYGENYNLTNTAIAAQSQGTATNYGANAGALTQAAWMAPLAGYITGASIFVDTTPAVGQTFTFNLQKSGSTIGSLVVNNGGFGGGIVLSPPISVSQGQQLSIQSVFSASSGSATPRYSINLQG